MMRFEIPAALQRTVRYEPAGRGWLAGLPEQIEHYLQRWKLVPDLPAGTLPWTGHCGVVIPVIRRNGGEAALKLTVPHDEAQAEADALEAWAGRGAVRLLDADKPDLALLLERLDGDRSLQQAPMDVAIHQWGRLMQGLSVPPAEQTARKFDQLAARAEQWTDEFPARWEQLGRPFERWLLEAALEVCQVNGAVGRRWNRDVLVHSDLHFLNILARRDDPGEYVAIDPKPVYGDAEFAVAPMLWNRLGELPKRNPEIALLDRMTGLCTAAGLDPELARQWSLVREVENALSYYDDGHPGDAQRSLWVASSLAGKHYPGLPAAHDLPNP
ncbi:aminoglycoside phosphotransferase family protein [Arthrobacter castelli]|uniref:aminoglycoside phosphotransferase family protein n=1 Tax=Arthrobacter castelli TaxID=271431 RepID=UPI0004031A29|nr:aminoglycoside phosphotransferase family protein [Arthrobacter castelli]